MTFKTTYHKNGFALLMTPLVVSVVIPVVLTILDVSLKQVRLSSNAKESEAAFSAAVAGAECAQYLRRVHASDFEMVGPTSFNVSCLGLTDTAEVGVAVLHSGGSHINHFTYDFSWGSGATARCVQVSAVIMVAEAGLVMTANAIDLQTAIPQFPAEPATVTCDPGGRCTFISVRGYNRTCPGPGATFPLGTIQREVLLEF